MKLHVGVGLEPMFVFLVGVEVIEDDVKLAVVKAVFSFNGHCVGRQRGFSTFGRPGCPDP